MKQSFFWHRFVLAVSLFNSFSTANAVEITARIEGTITDPSGAVIPNAQAQRHAFSACNLLLSGWQISGIATFATGAPFDLVYGSNSASPGNSLWCSPGPGMSYYACPDIPQQVAPIVRPDIRTMIVNPTTGASTNRIAFFKTPGLFPGTNPSFVDEPIGTFGNVSRNKYHGPGINNTNIIIAKNFALSSDNVRYLQLRMKSDNVFNLTQFSKPISSFTTPNFGGIISAAAGRRTQLAVKFYF